MAIENEELNRIVTAKVAGGQEEVVERALRPRLLDEYVGQEKIRNQLREQLIFESYAQGLCRTTQDQKEAVKAFMEKREPVFKGL